MNAFQKLHYTLNFAKKFANSHEYSFAKKLVKDPHRHYNTAAQFVKGGGLKKAKSYMDLARGIQRFNDKTLPKYSKAYSDMTMGLAPNPFQALSTGLGVASNVSMNVGRGIQRGKKAKSSLEKGANVARTGLDIYRSVNPNFM